MSYVLSEDGDEVDLIRSDVGCGAVQVQCKSR